MQADDARLLIKKILESDIKFDGHFDKCFSNLKDTQQKEIIEWVRACKELRSNPIQSKTNREIMGFVKRIRGSIRAILTKEKKGYFIELFLDKHKYYETEMNKLGF